MLFNSLDYLIFLPITWSVYWLMRRFRLEVLLVASYVFYASWSIPYAALMFGLAVANFLFGRVLARARRRRRVLLALFVGFDLGVLALFKYWTFAVDSVWWLGDGVFGAGARPFVVQLVLPLGISFFTFEFIHYLVDLYRGAVPVHAFSKFHVFAAFFPTQIAGPIKRFQQFVPALGAVAHFDSALAVDGLRLIGIGLVKKMLIADRLAPMANRGFDAASVGSIGTAEAWISVLAFSLQIFFDFSGYTDIARGSAQLFGFHIPLNFDGPYLATSVSDFWRRWHISLSQWLRDYVFIPLGGSRRAMPRIVFNLLITMTLGGLWHGAAWHFVAWGAFWGAALAAHHVLRARVRVVPTIPAIVAGWALTQIVVLIGWVLFRAETFEAAGTMLRSMFVLTAGGGVQTASGMLFVVITAVVLLGVTLVLRLRLLPTMSFPRGPARPVLVGLCVAFALIASAITVPASRQSFIYFQF